jgi:RND family efflux transporter MFP subunit
VEIPVKQGQSVKKGQVLSRVYSEQVKAAFDMARASLAQAEDGFERIQKLKDGGAVADVKVVEIETQLAQARAAQAAARQTLEEGILKAPFDGVVGEVYAQKGIRVDVLQPLVQLLDRSGTYVRFAVPETEILQLNPGMAVEIEVPALEKTFQATVETKGVVGQPLSHAYDCLARVTDKSLLPGMVCKAHFESVSDRYSIVVPQQAIQISGHDRFVWLVIDGKTHWQSVTTGEIVGGGVVIESGLTVGDVIIIEGQNKVCEDAKVVES